MDLESQRIMQLADDSKNLHHQYEQALKDLSDRQSEVWEQEHMLLAQVRELEKRLPKKPSEDNSGKLTALRKEIRTLRLTREIKKQAALKPFVKENDLSADAGELENMETAIPELIDIYLEREGVVEDKEKELKAKKDECEELYEKLRTLPSRTSLVRELEKRREQKANLEEQKSGILEKLVKLGTLEKLQKLEQLEEANRKKQEEMEELTKTVEKLRVEWEAFRKKQEEMAVLTDERQSQAVSAALTDDNQAGKPETSSHSPPRPGV